MKLFSLRKPTAAATCFTGLTLRCSSSRARVLDFVLELLQARAFLLELAVQGARRQVQMRRNAVRFVRNIGLRGQHLPHLLH